MRTEAKLMQGNQAIAEGAFYAGARFYAGYPITPSSEIAEECSKRMLLTGGVYMQMEDEIGSMAAIIGASLAGAKSFTATSGPVTVVKPSFEWINVPTQMTLGAMTGIYVRTYVPNGSYYNTNTYRYGLTYQAVDQATTVSLSSENSAVIQAPATATITAGNYNTSSFNIQAVGTGTSTLTLSAPGWDSKTSGTITVN